jgi:hypothetical protein
MPDSENDQAMERIWAGLARIHESLDEIAKMREQRNRPKRPQLTLVRNDDEEGDDG